MAARAIRAFQDQTYLNAELLIWNTGKDQFESDLPNVKVPQVDAGGMSIGELRNVANKYASAHYAMRDHRPEILCHWDDDDWSYPGRIAEQVRLLQQGETDAVGYADMPFWVSAEGKAEAWLYVNGDPEFILGTSLCYWRRTWEAKPFPDIHRGEDNHWIRGLRRKSYTAYRGGFAMVACRHGSNTVEQVIDTSGDNWTRRPDWDESLGRIMAL